jgi:CheY-like chemotaxis protein
MNVNVSNVENTNPSCVLLVDDDLTSLYLSNLTIARSGMHVHTHQADNAETALQFVKENCHSEAIEEIVHLCPDIIFLDINMPGMDGFDFLTNFKQIGERLRKSIRIFMLTSSESPRDKSRALEFGVDGYIVKPLTSEKLKVVF